MATLHIGVDGDLAAQAFCVRTGNNVAATKSRQIAMGLDYGGGGKSPGNGSFPFGGETTSRRPP
jgi:hypothetical protein